MVYTHSMQNLRTNDQGGIRGAVITVALVIILAVLWQLFSDQQKQDAAVIRDAVYATPLGEVTVVFPDNWAVGTTSFEEQGYYSLELEGPRNASIARQINEKYSVDINAGDISNTKLIEMLDDPLAADYVLVLIDIVSAAEFELSESPEAWQARLLENTNTTSGVSFSGFEPSSISGADGFQYRSQIEEGGSSTDILNYYLLGQTAEIEVSIFPADSNNSQAAQDIVEAINVTQLPK